jgi:hypothetical protein
LTSLNGISRLSELRPYAELKILIIGALRLF